MSVTTVDEDRGTLQTGTEQFSLKSEVDASGQEREYIEGFVATTHLDKGNDRYTKNALEMMAKDITQGSETVDAVFRDMDESQIGNVNHDNNPAAPGSDTRIVPAFKIVDAQIKETDDGEDGLWIKGMLNSNGLPGDTVSAIKNSIKDGFLNAFSVEYVAKKARQVMENGRVIRIIEAAEAKGAALTGRPMNPEAELTGAELKSMTEEFIDETKEEKDITMTDEDEQDPEPEEGAEPEPEEGQEEVEQSGEQEEEQETKGSFAEDVEELKSTVQDVKEVNDDLRDENEELKSELEDLRQLQEIKSEVDEVKSILEDIELEDGPHTGREQKTDRFEDEQETKADWKQAADRLGTEYLEGKGNSMSNIQAFAENHGIKTEEVKNYVNSD